MSATLRGALRVLAVLLQGLSWLATPIAIVWLIGLRQWWAVGVAMLSLLAPLVLGLALLPGLALAASAAGAMAKHRGVALLVGIVGLLYAAALITAWCMGVFTFLLGKATSDTLIPLLLLSFSLGTGPWRYLARRELREGRRGEVIQTFFMQLAFVTMIAFFTIVRPEGSVALWWIFGSVMAVEVVVYAISIPRMPSGGVPPLVVPEAS